MKPRSLSLLFAALGACAVPPAAPRAAVTTSSTPSLAVPTASNEASVAPAVERESDPPNEGPVAFYTATRDRKTRYFPGDFIDAQISLDAPLMTAGANATFSVEVELSSRTHTYLGQCKQAIDGASKEGAQLLVSRSITVSVIPKPHDDALLASGCEPDVRRVLEGQDVADVFEIRGELRLLEVMHDPLTMKDTQRTVASGAFLIDISGGRDAIDRGIAKLDAAHEQERRDAIPSNRMPRSKLPSLEPAAMQAVKDDIDDTSMTEFVPLRVVITEREWTVERNDRTSAVLRRSIAGTVAFRRTDKTCFSEDVTFEEEFDGLRYQALAVDLPTHPSGDDLLCENVMK